MAGGLAITSAKQCENHVVDRGWGIVGQYKSSGDVDAGLKAMKTLRDDVLKIPACQTPQVRSLLAASSHELYLAAKYRFDVKIGIATGVFVGLLTLGIPESLFAEGVGYVVASPLLLEAPLLAYGASKQFNSSMPSSLPRLPEKGPQLSPEQKAANERVENGLFVMEALGAFSR